MQTFYLIVKKDCLSLFEKNGNTYERVYLGGNPEFYYSINSAKENIDKFMKMIIEEYNLDSISEIDLMVINNEEKIVSDVVTKVLGESVRKTVQIDLLMKDILQKLNRDKELLISEYGVNFDGKNYLLQDGEIKKEEFSLLGHTLSDELLMRYVG